RAVLPCPPGAAAVEHRGRGLAVSSTPHPQPPAREEAPVRTFRRLGLASLLTLLAAAGRPCWADTPGDAEEEIVQLYKSNKLFDKGQYKAVRAAFARLFEQRHAGPLRRAYGGDHDALAAWLEARPEVKQNFYTALDERHDRIEPALALFKEVWKKFPDRAEKYANLAIATAVTWDDERGVYDYRQHQRRTRSNLPSGMVDALGNFEYVSDHDKAVEGRAQLLPWEALVFVVDHRTPVAERRWAQNYFKTTRGRVRSWHQDVPYDHDMLRGERDKGSGLRPRLQDRLYTLGNIKSYGGVCAMQADFAARVGKSMCIPAAFCWGKSAHRG